MASLPVMQQTLGAAWPRLAPVIRRHYALPADSGAAITVAGEMQVEFPTWVWPLLKLIRLFGGLLDRRGNGVITTVKKYSLPGRAELFWQRELQYPDGSQLEFRSRMQHWQDDRLIEWVGGGFGLRLALYEQDGDLVYCSDGHVFKLGTWLLRFPDWLLLGHARISEHALSDGSFALDFVIVHPLWGRTFAYRGVFRVEADRNARGQVSP